MKKEIMEALKAKFAGVSDTILGRVAEKLAKTATTGEQVAAAVEAYTLQQLIEGYGDSRATEASQTAVHGYETRYGLRDGEKIEKGGVGGSDEPTPPRKAAGGVGGDMPEWAKALMESNREMGERLDKMAAERTTASRRQQLNAVISKLPENLRKGYERTGVESIKDDEFEQLMGEIRSEVDGIVRETQQRGVIFGRPNKGATPGKEVGKNGASQEEARAVVERMRL